jgi:hypothetical protein
MTKPVDEVLLFYFFCDLSRLGYSVDEQSRKGYFICWTVEAAAVALFLTLKIFASFLFFYSLEDTEMLRPSLFL